MKTRVANERRLRQFSFSGEASLFVVRSESSGQPPSRL